MALRISGVTIPNEKRIEISLTYIFGIGLTTSRAILDKLKIDRNTRVKDVSEEDANKLRQEIEKKFKTEGDLKREIAGNIKRLKEINCYRGLRHAKKLSVRGQRTKTNSRTVRGGGRKTAVSGKKNAPQKT